MNLNQITIPVTNLEQSINFYESLGLILIVKSAPDYARFECPDGGSTFSLHRVNQPSNSPNGSWIYFETEQVDNVVNTLIQKGFVFEELPTDKPWLWREACLKDPDNNHIIIYFAGNNRLNPPWRLKQVIEK